MEVQRSMTAGNTSLINEGNLKSLSGPNAPEFVNQWQVAVNAIFKQQGLPNPATLAPLPAVTGPQLLAQAQNLWAAQQKGTGLPVAALDTSGFLNAAAAQAQAGLAQVSKGFPANFNFLANGKELPASPQAKKVVNGVDATKVAELSGAAAQAAAVAKDYKMIKEDERELKKQRRKQSNRESARRSRLRKQAECEELSVRVHKLSQENGNLQSELSSMKRKCDQLVEENKALSEQLKLKVEGKKAKTIDDE